MQAKVAAPN
jgi:hypothetical protein